MKFKKRKLQGQKMSAYLHPKKCKKTRKTMFATQQLANRAMMRIWSHDPKLDIHDFHSYLCPDCTQWHLGHKSYYQEAQARQNESTGIQSNLP